MIDSKRFRAAFVVLLALSCTTTTGTAQELLPEDTCIVEITAPDDATIRIDGRTYTDKRTFTFEPLTPGKYYSIKVEQLTRARVSQTRNVLLEGGRRIKVHLAAKDENRPELVLQTGHSAGVNCMAFSADGTRMVTGSSDKTAIVWSVETGRQLQTLRGHSESIRNVDITANGRYVLTGVGSDNSAILWDANSGERLRTLSFDNKWVETACFDHDEARAWVTLYDLHGTKTTTISLWNVKTGSRIRQFNVGTDSVSRLVVSPDGRLLFCFCGDKQLVIRTAETGRMLKTLTGVNGYYATICFSPDNAIFALAIAEHDQQSEKSTSTLSLYDAKSFNRISRKECQGRIARPYYSADGRTLFTFLTRNLDENTHESFIEQRDPQTLAVRSTMKSPESFGKVEFCLPADNRCFAKDYHDGRKLLTIVNMATGRHIRHVPIQNRKAFDISIGRPNRSHVLLESGDESGDKMMLWDVETATALWNVQIEDPEVNHISDLQFSSNGNYILGDITGRNGYTRETSNRLVIFDAETGRELYRLDRRQHIYLKYVSLSSNGRLLAMIEGNDTRARIDIWDLKDKRQIQSIKFSEFVVNSAFSPDGRQLHVGQTIVLAPAIRWPNAVRTFSVRTGTKLAERTLRDVYRSLSPIAVSPDGRFVASEGQLNFSQSDATKKHLGWVIWDTVTGRAKQTLVGQSDESDQVAFSPNGRMLFCCSSSYFRPNEAIVWNLDNGQIIRRFGRVESASFNEDGSQLFTCSIDGTLKMHDLLSGDEIMTLALLDDEGNWLTATPQGLFDGTPKGRQLVTARVPGGKLVPIDRFFQDFYRPGLLKDVLKGARPVTKAQFGKSAPPRLELASKIGREVEADTVQFDVKLTEQGGGFQTPWIMHNGARILAKPQLLKEGKQKLYRFEVALIEGNNRLEVLSASADGSWESEPARLDFRRGAPLQQSAVHVVSIGVSDYAEETMNLKFAADDARSISSLFNQRGPRFYGKDKVHVTQLLDKEVTKAGIQAAIGKVANQAKPQDTFVLFLAGHGTVIGQRYYFITHDFKNDGGKLEENIRTQGFAGDELDDAIRAVPALKRVVIYDTCHSGGVAAINRGARDPFEFRGALERMSRAQGSFTIAATAATAQAQELPALKHGVLTYALLAGLGAADEGPLKAQQIDKSKSVVDVRDWFEFAQEKVPLMTKLFLGEEQFVGFSGQGVSFPILPAKAADTSKPEKE